MTIPHVARWAVAASALALCAPPAQAIDLFGWQATDFPTSLVKWQDPPSRGTVRIGSTNDFSFDPAFSPAGVLYGTDGQSIFTINLTTGQTSPHTNITSHIFGLNEFMTGLAFSPTGTLYCWTLNSTTSGIYTLNPVTGTAAVITYNTPQSLFGMTFGPDGTLYASDGSDLLKLNPGNGQVLQNLGVFPQFITSLGYGPDGVLRGLSPNFSANGTDLYSIDPHTAGLTFLGSSVEDIYGIAAIPGPGGAVLLAGVGAAMGRRRRRR